MTRRHWFRYLTFPAASLVLLKASEVKSESLRGRLVREQAEPFLMMASGQRYLLHGDKDTTAVLADERVPGADFEVIGHRDADGAAFTVDPIHTKAMWVYQKGQRLQITYWCDVCYIRTYSPGLCWCCQKYTDLDLRTPESL